MDIESKIWSLTNTGTKLHVFKDGAALCSKAVRERSGPGEGFDYCEAKQGPFKICTRCDARFNAALEAAETAEPCNNPKKEDPPMGYDQRKRTGPLSSGQRKIVEELVAGKRQGEIARETHVSPSHVSAEARVAATRMGVTTTNAMCARWGTALAYLDAADLIERDANYSGEDAVAAVLQELVKILRSRAAALIPS